MVISKSEVMKLGLERKRGELEELEAKIDEILKSPKFIERGFAHIGLDLIPDYLADEILPKYRMRGWNITRYIASDWRDPRDCDHYDFR